MMYGGLPLILDQKTDEQKRNYLISLFNTTSNDWKVENAGVIDVLEENRTSDHNLYLQT